MPVETHTLRVHKRRVYDVLRYVRDRYHQKHGVRLDLIDILSKIVDNADLEALFDIK